MLQKPSCCRLELLFAKLEDLIVTDFASETALCIQNCSKLYEFLVMQVVQKALVLPLVESTISQHQSGKGPGSAPASDQLGPVSMLL